MTSPEPVLPETRERRCPACQSEQIVHAGHVIGAEGMLKAEHRCEACGIAFWFVRKRIATMTSTAPWHSALATDRHVYHHDTRCPEGHAVALIYRRADSGGRPECEHCAGF